MVLNVQSVILKVGLINYETNSVNNLIKPRAIFNTYKPLHRGNRTKDLLQCRPLI
jgi:hypothetical protein